MQSEEKKFTADALAAVLQEEEKLIRILFAAWSAPVLILLSKFEIVLEFSSPQQSQLLLGCGFFLFALVFGLLANAACLDMRKIALYSGYVKSDQLVKFYSRFRFLRVISLGIGFLGYLVLFDMLIGVLGG